MIKTRSILKLLPSIGIFTFIGIYIYTASLYPGGSQADVNSVGFDWAHNYWCNLMNAEAMNGQTNPASTIAIGGMVLLCASMTLFFFQFADHFEHHKKWKLTIKISGALAMLSAVFIFTKYHDVMTSILSFFGLVVIIGILRALHKSKLTFFKISGIACMLLVSANNIFYYREDLIQYLPIVQKISFTLILAWTIGLNLKMWSQSREKKSNVVK